MYEHPRSPNTHERVTTRINLHYFVDPREVHDYSPKKWRKLDEQAEQQYVHTLSARCQNEQVLQRRAVEDAQGWFFVDEDALEKANGMELKNCKKLDRLSKTGKII